jgi:hypothetical protein
VAEALFGRQLVPDDQKLTKEDFERMLQWLIDQMHAANGLLWDMELTYTGEQGDDNAAADERDRSGTALDDGLRIARNSAQQIGGERVLESFGMASPPPGDQSGLARYAENAIRMMRSHSTPVSKAGLTFDPNAVADSLEPTLQTYTGALSSVATESRQLEDAKGRRDQAQATWKTTYQSVAGQLEGLFRLAGRDDLADRVRPTHRRTRGAEGPEVVVDEPVEPVEPVGV